MIKEAVHDQILSLYYLQKKDTEVEADVQKGVKNIIKWINMVFNAKNNQHGLKMVKFMAAEQEFNTWTYGIKGNIDCTIQVQDGEQSVKCTALEIKTGKRKSFSYRGQVLLYSLLISERFKNANPENILLYIMDEKVEEGFEYIKRSRMELDQIVMARNELAKWYKRNSSHPELL